MTRQGEYTGRFAPSPTGPLHFGSLVAALASFLDARHAGGRWLLRIEDLDPPRESPSAPATIIDQLRAFGLDHDDEVLYQSSRLPAYEAALAQLTHAGLTYPCICSRASAGAVYKGRCRRRSFQDQQPPYAVRINVAGQSVSFTDRVAGKQFSRLEDDVGDFIIKRKDGLFAYQLAVVVDDAFQGITHVVRGNDLLTSTPRQIYLARCLGYPPISYCHLPVIVDAQGDKLSKQNHASPVATEDPLAVLGQALRALGQPDHPGVRRPDKLLQLAVDAWNPDSIPRRQQLGPGDLQQQNT